MPATSAHLIRAPTTTISSKPVNSEYANELASNKIKLKIRNPPCKREPLGYEHVFNETDAERLQHGLNGNAERQY